MESLQKHSEKEKTTVKVSIGIPVYAVEKYIERCARSLFEQTMQEGIEFIFVNNCTPDRSIEILKQVLEEYPHRKEQVKILHHDQNRGLVAARKTALAAACGDYIIHCDSDDWVELDMYEAMYSTAVKNDADVVYSQYCLDSGTGSIKPIPFPQYDTVEALLHGILQNNLHWNLWVKMFRREIAQAPNIYSPNEICFGEDLLASTQMVLKCRTVAYCPGTYYHYFCDNAGSYTKNFQRKSLDQLMSAVAYLEGILPKMYSMSACKGEILFKAVFYGIMSWQEFHSYSSGIRWRVLRHSGIKRSKKLILIAAFCCFPLTKLICAFLRKIK